MNYISVQITEILCNNKITLFSLKINSKTRGKLSILIHFRNNSHTALLDFVCKSSINGRFITIHYKDSFSEYYPYSRRN